MTLPAVLPATPYISFDQLQREPLGVSWASLVPRTGASSNELNNILADLCQQATGMVDGCCNQPLRATLNTEELTGPGDNRVGVDMSTGVASVVLRRGPVLQVTRVRVSPARSFPRAWTTVTPGCYEPAIPVIGMYGTSSPADSGEGGQMVLIQPGWVTWDQGRRGYRVEVSYINGWPHTSLTASAAAGDSVLTVDDCTGWAPVAAGAPGAVGVVYDAGQQEAVTVTAASATSGPGTLTLASPLGFPHNAGVMTTTMPDQLRWATALLCAAQALTRGATTTTVHATGGGTSQGSSAPKDFVAQAQALLNPFKRVW